MLFRSKIKNLPGIVSVRDFFSANGTAYIVMEFLDGISLKKYLQRKGGKVPCDEIVTVLRPVMDSLVQVHKLGLIHRDISPDNIIITKNGEVKLIDFGAAKQSNLDGKSLSIVLKQGFAPEEQYRTHGEQGPWTDIYALGVTIYYAVTGTLPPESIQRLYKDTIIRPSEKGAIISPTQESALMKSLAVYARHRYQDVTQMITGLCGRKSTSAATATRRTLTESVAAENAGLTRANSARLSRPTGAVPSRPASLTEVHPERINATYTPGIKNIDKRAVSNADEHRASAAQPARQPNAERNLSQTSNAFSRPAPNGNIASRPAAEPEPAERPQRTITVTKEHKPTLMERLFGKKKK